MRWDPILPSRRIGRERHGWWFGWKEPYDGAFAEAFDLGCGRVVCGTYWFSQIGWFYGEPLDAYV
ncbi:MAG: hypothetical protein GF330_07985 [Candidatus Eisenbacteria bacterium]|nr:hypothetical protein [Candidatus Eisenbacteria bacterium]